MNESFEQFHNSWNKEHLDVHEKAIIRARLQKYMVSTPMPQPQKAVPSTWSVVSVFQNFHFKMVPAALIAVLLLSSGISAAAETAIPGDFTYSVKLANEELKGFFILSDEARAEYFAERAERRLKEAEKLAQEKRLTPEAQEGLSVKLAQHVSDVKESVTQLEKEDKLEDAAAVASELEASLNAHAKRFDKIVFATQDEAGVNEVKAQVKAEAETVASVRVAVEEKVKNNERGTKTKDSAEETKLELEAVFTELAKLARGTVASTSGTSSATSTATSTASSTPTENPTFAATLSLSATPATTTETATTSTTTPAELTTSTAAVYTAEISARVEEATSAYNEGVSKLNEGKPNEAYSLFLKAKRSLKEAEVNIKID